MRALLQRWIEVIRQRPLVILGILYFAVNLVLIFTRHGDFVVYYAASVRYLEGAEIYLNEPNPFTYPPFAALFFVPLTWLGLSGAKVAFFMLNFGALIWGLQIVHRELLKENGPHQKYVIALTWVFCLRFVQSAFNNQQTDLIIFALISLGAVAFARSQIKAVSWWSVAAATKANPIFMVLAPLFVGRWRWSMAMLGILTVLLVLPDILNFTANSVPQTKEFSLSQTIVSYKHKREPKVFALLAAPNHPLHHLQKFITTTFLKADNSWWSQRDNPLNQSLTRIVARFFGVPNIVFLSLCTAFAWLLWLGRRVGRSNPFIYAFLFYCAFVLIGPVASKPHFVAFYGLLLFCWQNLFSRFHSLKLIILLPVSVMFGLTSAGMLGEHAYDIAVVGHIGIASAILWLYSYFIAVVTTWTAPGAGVDSLES